MDLLHGVDGGGYKDRIHDAFSQHIQDIIQKTGLLSVAEPCRWKVSSLWFRLKLVVATFCYGELMTDN